MMTTLFYNIGKVATLEQVVAKSGANLAPEDISFKSGVCIVANQKEILWVGKQDDIPNIVRKQITKEVNLQSKIVTPSLVDSHTHLIFSGNRSKEFSLRLDGASYEQIAQAGGGIKYSSEQTNSASDNELYELARKRLEQLYVLGVGACEIKTGYSLTLEGEISLLRIIDRLKNEFSKSIHIHRTLMSAHAIPKNLTAADYIENIVLPSITQAAKDRLVDSVDVFHEKNYFSTVDVEKIFNHAKSYELSLKLHADELNDNQGAKLAAKYKCLSADHLLKTDEEGAALLKKNSVIATLLPGTALFLGKPLPNANQFIKAGCAVAIASDFNPGSCHFNDIFQIARFTAPSLALNQAQFWAAITYNAARAINLQKHGAIIAGFAPKMICWDSDDFNDLLYNWCTRPNVTHL